MGTVGHPRYVLLAYTSSQTLFAFCVVGIVVTILTAITRIYVRINTQGRLHPDDYALLVALGLYLTLAGLYMADIPYMYAFLDFTSGQTAFSAATEHDFYEMMMFNFAVTPMYWAILWAVKISLMLFFRRVVRNTNWMRAWWIILVVTCLAFVGCLVSQFLSCDSIADFTVLGACVKARNTRAQLISLYFSFAADVLTDLAIMGLPLRVVFSLQMTTRDRLGIAALFSTNIIAIVVSMIRVFLIWAKTGSTSPSPAWLGLWAIIECMIAIICGCIPAISQMFRPATVRAPYGQIQAYGNGSRVSTKATMAYSGLEVACSMEDLALKGDIHARMHEVMRNDSVIASHELSELRS